MIVQNQKYFKFSKTPQEQKDAQHSCKSSAGRLAQFTSKDLQNKLLQVFSQHFSKKENSDVQFWIGLSKNGGNWNWLDGSDISETFGFNSSSSSPGQCAAVDFADFIWKPFSCKRLFSCICENGKFYLNFHNS